MQAQPSSEEHAVLSGGNGNPPGYGPFRAVEFPRTDSDWARIHGLSRSLGELTCDVIEWALEAAVDESEAAVERTARSTIIREQHDYRASLSTVDCDSITHVSFAATPDPIRAHFSLEEMSEGDIFLYNDVYQPGGTVNHLPDYCVTMPVISDGRVIAFSQIFGHCNDVGGRVVGSWPITSRSVFEEGLLCPPIRLYHRGVLNEDAYKIVLRNSRFPDDLRGDIDAFVGGTRILTRRVLELCSRYGTDVVEATFYRVIDRCEQIIRDVVLPQIPNGEYVGEDFVENDGITLDKPVKIQITIRKSDDEMILDFAGTDAQTEGPINLPCDGRFLTKWIGAFLKAYAPGMIVNEGVTRVVRCVVPEKTVLSPEFPAPCANRMMCYHRMTSAFFVAMAKAMDGNVIGDMHCIQVYGLFGDDLEGNFFLYREIFGAGSGARPYADGTDAVDMVPRSKNLPAEFIEQRYPVIVESVGLNVDSGGPGLHRGGLGYVKDIRTLVDGSFLTNVERTAFAPWGVAGGGAGKSGGSWINPGTDDEAHVLYSREAIPVKAGDIIRVTTPGGGGWGDALERDPEAVRLDVSRGLVSRGRAAEDYGVVVEPVDDHERGYRVDEPATEALRREMRDAPGGTSLIDRGDFARELIREGAIEVADS